MLAWFHCILLVSTAHQNCFEEHTEVQRDKEMNQGENSGAGTALEDTIWQARFLHFDRVQPHVPAMSLRPYAMPMHRFGMRRTWKYYPFLKQSIDIVFALVGLIVAMPLMILIAIAIKLDSPGPVLFRQKRIGKNRRYHSNGHLKERRRWDLKGKPFVIYKFRTMRADADPYAISPSDDGDPRLTRVGRVIRSLCLDELPQLINVLKGDMSLVGPRPEMPFIVQKYNMIESLRLLVKPGITGLWQLHGSRKKHIHENLHYDLEYIQKCCLLMDLKILVKTLGFVLKTKNV